MKRYNFLIAAFAAASMIFFSCNREIDLITDQNVLQEIEFLAESADESFVSLEKATDIAEAFFSNQSVLKNANTSKTILSAETLKDNGNPSMYVINYSEGLTAWI